MPVAEFDENPEHTGSKGKHGWGGGSKRRVGINCVMKTAFTRL